MNKFRDMCLKRHNSPKHWNIFNKFLQHNVQRDITGHSIRTCLNKYRDKSEGPLFRNLDAQLPQMILQIASLTVILLSLSLSLSLSNTLIHTYIHTYMHAYMCVCVCVCVCAPLLSRPSARTSYSTSLISNLKSLTLLIITADAV